MRHRSPSGRLYKRLERVVDHTLSQCQESSVRASVGERGYVWHDGPTSKEAYFHNLDQIECLKQEFRL